MRSTAFLIADGVLPSNEGRGYVLRRIMRRAMRHATMLGAHEPLIYRLVPTLTRQMGAAYPELVRAEQLITETLKLEETRFKTLLERGLGAAGPTRPRGLGHGRKIARRGGVPAVRHVRLPAGPDAGRVARARARGRPGRVRGRDGRATGEGSRGVGRVRGGGDRTGVVRDRARRWGATEFLGYSTETAEARSSALVGERGVGAVGRGTGADVAVVLNQTPFYAESGGQVGDTGTISGTGWASHRGRRHPEEAG